MHLQDEDEEVTLGNQAWCSNTSGKKEERR